MDSDIIAKELAKDLDRKYVRPAPQGKFGEYIEGWHVIAEANRIFGWDGWSYTISRLEVTNCDPNKGRNSDQWEVGYMAVVEVSADGVIKQDVGHGQGYSKSLGDAHESAMKEAVTDALKRAMRTFGHPFGLALYDKTKAHVSDDPDRADKLDENADREMKKIATIWDMDEFKSYWKALITMQPDVARHVAVVAVKDDQKIAILAKQKEQDA